MLDLARCRAGQGIAVVLTPTNLHDVLEQVVQELQTANVQREIKSVIEISTPVRCDGGRVAQLVSNLLGNALTHGAPDSPVIVSAVVERDEIMISVAHEGAAIPEHVRSHLFEPFFRATGSSEKQGLGLGLFISCEIARSHGGKLEVESNETKTRFVFRMPVFAESH
jgi:phosphoserine phosphatase RsbU/P